MSMYCVVCCVGITRNDIKLLRVPKDPLKKANWGKSLGMELKDNARVCDKHFTQNDFKEKTNRNKPCKRRQLKDDAVPQRLDWNVTTVQSETRADSCSQTIPTLIQDGIMLENMRLNQRIIELKNDQNQLRQDLDKMQTLTESLQKIFTDNQLRKLASGGKKQCWRVDDISFAVCLYTAGSRAYRHLYSKGFPLPSLLTVQRWARRIKEDTGVLNAKRNSDLADESELSEDRQEECEIDMISELPADENTNNEQKMTKDMEDEIRNKLNNLVRNLDDNEMEFLELENKDPIVDHELEFLKLEDNGPIDNDEMEFLELEDNGPNVDDELEFLELDKGPTDTEQYQMPEEDPILLEFCQRVSELQEDSVDKTIPKEMQQTNQILKPVNVAEIPNQITCGVKRQHIKPKANGDDTSLGNSKCFAGLPGIGSKRQKTQQSQVE